MQRKTMVDYVKEVPQLLAKNVESASELVNPLINYVEGKEIKDILLIAYSYLEIGYNKHFLRL